MTDRFALTGATIVTNDTDGTVLPDHTILVDQTGTIDRVGPEVDCPVPDSYRTIDARGRFITPGLINAHAHLFSDGKPMPPILLNESLEGLVARIGHSRLGNLIFKCRATTNARILGLAEKTGALEPGLAADLVAFDANPLEDFVRWRSRGWSRSTAR